MEAWDFYILDPSLNFSLFSDAGVEISAVVDHDESAPEHHHFNSGSLGKSNFYSSHCHLYIRCTWDAIVRERLHGRKLLSRSNSSVLATKNIIEI